MTLADYNSDIHIKMCKKIAQLTKVIYNLNSKADEHETIVEAMKKEHKSMLSRIMEESKNQILAVKEKFQKYEEYEKQIKQATAMLQESDESNKRLQNSLNDYIEKSSLNERNLRMDYENKLLDLQNKLLERKREYSELVDSFTAFQNELAASKQGKLKEVAKHHNELQTFQKKHDVDIECYEKRQHELESMVAETQLRLENHKQLWQDERHQLRKENEEKINKLKALHEKELKSLNSQVKTEQYEKLEKEKENLIKDFEWRKSEFLNRLKFLENSVEKHEEEEEKNLNLKSLYEELERKLASKNEHVNSLHLQMGEQQMAIEQLQEGLKVEKENSLKQVARKEGKIKLLEEMVSDLSSSLDNKSSCLEESKIKGIKLEERCTSLDQELSFWKHKYNEENNNTNEQSINLKEQSRIVNELNQKITGLREKLHDLQELKKKEVLSLETKHKAVLLKEQDKHSDDIQKFKSESERILKESQCLLLEQFEKDKNKLLQEHNSVLVTKDNEQQAIELLLHDKSVLLQETELKAESTSKDFRNANENIFVLRKEINELNKQIVDLNQKLKDSNSKAIKYENLLTEIEEGASDEKKKLIEQRSSLDKQYQQKLKDEQSKFEKEIEEKIKTLETNHAYELEKLKCQYQNKLASITKQFEDEVEKIKSLKENEISILKNDVNDVKSKLESSRNEHLSQQLKYENDITKLKARFDEITDRIKDENTEKMEELKSSFVIDLENKESGWHLMVKEETSLLKIAHEKEIEDLQRGHQSTLSALKSQLNIEHEKNMKQLRLDFDSEKVKLQDFFRLQNEEKLKQMQHEFEAEISLLKHDLANNKELRQKEFSVHTSKVTDLSKSLEEEREVSTSLKKSLNDKELETHTIRKELESKVEEVLAIRRECNSRLRHREEEMSGNHQNTIENLQREHVKELLARNNKWKDENSRLQLEISNLTVMLNEAEKDFLERPSRDEDLQFIKQLQEKILQQESICQKLNDEKKYYKLELVNREENFNKIFNTSPNVGFMNPVEMTRKKSSKKSLR